MEGTVMKRVTKRKRTAYIIHPVTTGKDPLHVNLANISDIRRKYVRDGQFIPVVPTDMLQGIVPVLGDQTEAYAMGINLLLACDEAHCHGDWQNSIGCMAEFHKAQEHGIKVMVCS